MKTRPLAVRFWEKVDKNGPVVREGLSRCWMWTAALDRNGYGKIGIREPKRDSVKASRVSWELARGAIPAGRYVLHRCDNPPCVNPDHLFLGDAGDNIRDAVAKGRHGSQRDPARFRAYLKKASEAAARAATARPPKACSNCRGVAKPSRKGRCAACAEHLRRTGVERPSEFFEAVRR